MSGLLLAGDVYFDRLTDAGVSTGLVGPINVTQLQINTPSESVDRTSKKKTSYGQVLDSVVLPQPTELTIAIDDQPADLLALALLGDVEVLNQASASVSAAAFTLPAANKWLKLPQGNLASAGLAVFESDGVTGIAAAAYEINYALGMIRTTPDGVLDTGSSTDIKMDYTHNAISGSRIKGAIRSIIRVKLYLDGTNLATGLPVKLQIPEAVVAPTEAVDLFASEYVSATLAGKIKLLDGETAPFYLDQESA
ncbi:hypothetical protein [Marinobacterium rhizophilum]|uniref:Major tail protein n=1 Tax=Marinobacterium rhizophilum TaxID=420402 RepID=A0ABY5HNX2_9GAMM|nr:hypothetical protein [Marinobacterium rhizophilum]UTW12932.1 hypothetical protein KDW95_04460 [Marinobacterium rhizophilum]